MTLATFADLLQEARQRLQPQWLFCVLDRAKLPDLTNAVNVG